MAVRVMPYLNFRDETRAAVLFYEQVFGTTATVTTYAEFGMGGEDEAEKIMHAEVPVADGVVLLAGDVPDEAEHLRGRDVSVALFGTAEDRATIEAQWTRLADGATIDEPLEPSPWGDRFGTLTDRFGIRWYVNIAAEG